MECKGDCGENGGIKTIIKETKQQLIKKDENTNIKK